MCVSCPLIAAARSGERMSNLRKWHRWSSTSHPTQTTKRLGALLPSCTSTTVAGG